MTARSLTAGRSFFSGILSGWRGLGRFWLVVLLLLGIGTVVLQILGPPPVAAPSVKSAAVTQSPPTHQETALVSTPKPVRTEPPPVRAGRDTPGPIADPDPDLQQPVLGSPGLTLPRIGHGGRMPMAVYAAGFDPSSKRARIGLLIAGLGLSEADSLSAIKDLPGGITLAFSPYSAKTDRLQAAARLTEHEYLLSIPMEPQGFPANDPDDRFALMTSLSPADNLTRLLVVLSRLNGYVGVTNAFGAMRGERLSGVSDQLESVLTEVAHRGLLFVDARPGAPTPNPAWGRSADMVIDDEPIDASMLDQRLDRLSHIALDKGSALGIVSAPRPVTVDRIAAWANNLTAKGLALAPVSALARAPATQEAEK